MIKKVMKEIVIFVLLLAAIVLILTVLFYDSIPINKVVPSPVSYTISDSLKEELDRTIDEVKPTIMTYKIDQEDLNQYEKNDSYNPGKADPFGIYQGKASTPSTNVGGGSVSSGSSSSGTGSSEGETSDGSGATGGTSGSSSEGGSSSTTNRVVNK